MIVLVGVWAVLLFMLPVAGVVTWLGYFLWNLRKLGRERERVYQAKLAWFQLKKDEIDARRDTAHAELMVVLEDLKRQETALEKELLALRVHEKKRVIAAGVVLLMVLRRHG